MLELSVWMLDDMLRFRPIGRGVDPDLVILIRGEQLGAVQRVEIGCEETTVPVLQNNVDFLYNLYIRNIAQRQKTQP